MESKFYRGDAKRQLHREIEVMRGIHLLRPVVVVDEGHLLDREMLEEVRFLLNVRMDAQSPMALILVGQNELWDRLSLQANAAIRQRIDLQCKLPHYDRAQVGEYVRCHLNYAGTENDIFSDKAIDEIYRFSSGNTSVGQQTLHALPTVRCTNRPPNHRRPHGDARHSGRVVMRLTNTYMEYDDGRPG